MAGAVVGIILGGMKVCSVLETAEVYAEVDERDALRVLGVPTDFPSAFAAGSAGKVAPRPWEAGWVLPGARTGFVGSEMPFELPGGCIVDCRGTADP